MDKNDTASLVISWNKNNLKLFLKKQDVTNGRKSVTSAWSSQNWNDSHARDRFRMRGFDDEKAGVRRNNGEVAVQS